MPGGYWADSDLPSDVPPRPALGLCFVSKFLGQEIMRVFAQEHDLEVPTLVFGPLTNPEDCEPDQLGRYPFLVSWADAAEAVRGASVRRLSAPVRGLPYCGRPAAWQVSDRSHQGAAALAATRHTRDALAAPARMSVYRELGPEVRPLCAPRRSAIRPNFL
jgi:hypothetical protein